MSSKRASAGWERLAVCALISVSCSFSHQLGRFDDPSSQIEMRALMVDFPMRVRFSPPRGGRLPDPRPMPFGRGSTNAVAAQALADYLVVDITPNSIAVENTLARRILVSPTYIESIAVRRRTLGAVQGGALGFVIGAALGGYLGWSLDRANQNISDQPIPPSEMGTTMVKGGFITAAVGATLGAVLGHRDTYVFLPNPTH